MKQAFQEQLSLIRELQQIDLNLHNLQLELDKMPDRLKEVETVYMTAKNELDALKTDLSEVEKAKRNDESELAASVDHLRQREAKLYAIKTNKEYQAALKEVSEGKRLNREREDRILQAMEKIDMLTQKITQLSQETADKEIEYRAKQDEVGKATDDIHRSMEGDVKHRPDVAAKVDKVIFRKYEFVRQRYALAVAEVKGGICQGCSTRIPPQLFNEVLRKEEIKSCPSCQRLIFLGDQPAEDAGKNGG